MFKYKKLRVKLLAYGAIACLALGCSVAQADGLAELKTALARFTASGPIKGVVEARTWERNGEGKGLEEKQGLAKLSLELSARGLQVLYSKETLAALEAEEQAKEKDAKSKTPTQSGMKTLGHSVLRQIISASPKLSSAVADATFKTEKADNWNGKPARLLSFELGTDKLSEKERGAIKKFEGSLDVWIGADGVPLASRSHQFRSIRAMMVISFDITEDEDLTYGVVGDRLVAIKRETKLISNGMGEKGDSKSMTTFTPQP